MLALVLLAAAQNDNVPAVGEAYELRRRQTEPAEPEPQPLGTMTDLAYSIVIQNRVGGEVRIVEPPAMFVMSRPGTRIGTVTRRAMRARLVQDGQPWPPLAGVISSGVDGLRLRTIIDLATAGEISIEPSELEYLDADGVFRQPDESTIFVDTAPGRGIFGGTYPAINGSPVALYRDLGYLRLDPANLSLTANDTVVIGVFPPPQVPAYLELENRAGGRIRMDIGGDAPLPAGSVVRPLSGASATTQRPYCRCGAVRSVATNGIELACLTVAPLSILRLELSAAPLIGPAADEAQQPPSSLISLSGTQQELWQEPLLNGYFYPISGLERPRALPLLTVEVRFSGSPEWVPLSALVFPETLAQIDALRFSWLEQASGIDESLLPKEPEPTPALPPDDTPSLRQ